MKEFWQILKRYVKPYRGYLGGSVILNILSGLFNVFSFSLLIPILQILFNVGENSYEFIPWHQGMPFNEITNNVYWYTDATGFPIPDGLQLDSRVNPQEIVSRAYDAVLIPMDDGDWHVTVYCPATLSRPVVDRDGNEIDITRMKPGDEAYWNPASHVGVGTKQHPCQTVEVTVGGQKPFWAAVDGDYR